ncbi:hypothetical protein CC2G_008224 [Coprinopsis cinerea AmutBmut pab1-1]|nr:hypothetical protein CC2G_008224 [Coprinopsis cinerea AmutBmut pab1-1]
MKSGFFPATPTLPRTAFSFAVLRLFHLLQLEAKASAYDFCSALRRLSDNVFTDRIPNIYPQFIVAMQVWRVMVATKRSGQAHGIDSILTHRQSGNLLVHCPVCPEPFVNTDVNAKRVPGAFRHLSQLQLTADGNHHANRYMKNTDPLNRSLFDGRGYFPRDDEYKAYLGRLDHNVGEKSTCNYLNAAEKQDRKKFKNMDITGVVKIDCSHCFIKSVVDLQLGERFPNTDMALVRALLLYKIVSPDGSPHHIIAHDVVLSYDIACAYIRKLIDRVCAMFKEASVKGVNDVVKRIRCIIPAVHVHNHQDSCMYCFGPAYTQHIGHFHGETAEQPWVELNQLGPQIRQMNNGHRQDCIIDFFSDWNWKKLRQMASTLESETKDARDTYHQHKIRFHALCELHKTKIGEWNKLDREKREVKGKECDCVYSHSKRKVPSQQSIVDALLASTNVTSRSASVTMDTTVNFVNEGISIQILQFEIRTKMASLKDHPLSSLEKEVETNTKALKKRLDAWRLDQKTHMPSISEHLTLHLATKPHISDERLFLPSDFSHDLHAQLQIVHLAEVEIKLREGVAFDTIKTIQQYVKTSDALLHHKRTDARGQDQNTRANVQISRVAAKKKGLIDLYNANRNAILGLGHPQSDTLSRSFPEMKIEDTMRRAVMAKRALGDSRRFDGSLWAAGTAGRSDATKKRKSAPSTSFATGTSKHPPAASSSAAISKTIDIEDGWIWRLGSVGKLTEDEVREWEEEGDRVHWFRAEADMERWREQWEIKLIECIRCIRSFEKMAETWLTLSRKSGMPASQASFARKQAAMYRTLGEGVARVFSELQSNEPTRYVDGEDVVEYITRHRRAELAGFHPNHTPRLLLVCSVNDTDLDV